MNIQLLYKLIIVFLYSAFATYIAVPYVIKKLKKFGYVVPDMHKIRKPKIPVLGGVAIFIGIMVSLALSQLVLPIEMTGKLFIFYFIVIAYAMYGLMDDLFSYKRRYDKIIILFVLSLPIASLITNTILDLKLFSFELNGLYLLLLAPLYIMIVANLINIHAGFNGLGPGTTLIILIAAGIKSYMNYGLENLIYLMPILCALIIFFCHNKYPSKILDGNIGAFLMGSALGAFLIINKLELFGMFVLIPNIITLVLDFHVLGIKKIPDKPFPEPRKDGLIIPNKSMRFKSFKNLVCTLIPLTEKKATILILSITALLCVVGVIWL